jgi:zinc protease
MFRGLCLMRGFGVSIFLAVYLFAVSGSNAGIFNPESFTLKNGLKVVVIENHRMPVVRQMLFYKVGSADDPPGKSGLAHYLEHLMFKGTRSMAPNEFSRVVARNGGRDNAYTSNDTTAYYQTVAKDRLELVMKMEADRMANLVFDAKEVVPELQVVIEERRSRTDNRPGSQLNEHMAAALYMNHPYRVPIIGWNHELSKLTMKDAIGFYRRHYAPNNAILIVTGDVTMATVRPLVEKYYGPIPANPKIISRVRLAEPPQRAARRVSLESRRVREPQWSREYLAPSRSNGKSHHADALEVLDVIMGSGTTSRLYRALVLEQKLALGVGSYFDADMLGPTAFGISARPASGVSLETLEAAIEAEIDKLLTHGVSKDELAKAIKRSLAGAVFARDSLRRGASAIGTALTTGQTIESVETWPAKMKAVTTRQILDAARHVFKKSRSVTGLLLPKARKSSAKSSNKKSSIWDKPVRVFGGNR